MSDFAEEFEESWSSRLRGLAIPGGILLLVAGTIFYFLHDTAGIRREAPPLPTLIATLPPPPPPPPKQQPEPEKKVEEVQKVVEQPKALDNAPKPVTINGPAQAGSDAFNVGAGSGDGNVGSGGGGGFGEANYARYLGSQLQQTIQNDERVNRLVFSADMAVWVEPNGKLARAQVLKTSGDPKLDQVLVELLQEMPALDEPPSTLEFPQHIRVEGRRHA